MRLLINAVGLRAGGGLTVGLNCLRGIRQVRPDYTIKALVPAGHGYEELCASLSIPYQAFTKTAIYPAWRVWFDQVQVPFIARQWSADVLFTMNNQPAWRATCPQMVLVANPYYMYPVAEWWSLLTPFDRASISVQRELFGLGARRCARVVAQTEVAATRLRDQYGIDPHRLVIGPNAVAPEHHGPTDAEGRPAGRMDGVAAGRIRVLTLASYYRHKGLELIVRVARRLRELGDRRFVFFLTIAPEQDAGALALLRTIEREQLGDDVVNLGPLGYGELRSVYHQAQVCFLPTMLESMSAAYLEALEYHLPIVTTDRDFARATCGPAARYFPPGDVDAAIEQLRSAAAASPSPRHDGEVGPRPRHWLDVSRELAAVIDSIRRAHDAMPQMAGREDIGIP